jgi:TRAP-type C4-dicarboxylate transport system substrate-binding protein
MRPRLEAGLLAGGFVVLSWVDVGWTRFFTEKPVATPDDLRALKIFAWAGDSDGALMLKAARFNPVPLPSTELGTALGTGLVTALLVSPQIAVISQYYTRARNMTDLPWQLMIGATLISKTAWEKVPADLRPALLDASREAGLRLREEIRASGEKDIEEMKKRGLRVVPVDTKARVAWKQVSEAMLSRVRGTIVPAEAFDEALRLRDDYRKRRPSAR